jgi:hypothetical protein
MGRIGGRPRKAGERYPSGRLKKPGEAIAPARWGRIKNLLCKLAGLPEWENEIGRLLCMGELTNVQAASASKVGDVYRAYHRAKSLRYFAKSPNYERGFGDADLAEERMTPEQLEAFEARIRKAEEAWEKIDTYLAAVPRNVRQSVHDICIGSTPTNPMMLPNVRACLSDLAKRWEQGWRDQPQRYHQPAELKLVAPGRDNVEALTKHRRDTITEPLSAVVRKLRPDLDDDGIKQVVDVFHALRARADFRRVKLPRSAP